MTMSARTVPLAIKCLPRIGGAEKLCRLYTGHFLAGLVPDDDPVSGIKYKGRDGGIQQQVLGEFLLFPDGHFMLVHLDHHLIECLGQSADLVTGRDLDRLRFIPFAGDLLNMTGEQQQRSHQMPHEPPDRKDGEKQRHYHGSQQSPLCPVNRSVSFSLREIGSQYPVGGLEALKGTDRMQASRSYRLTGSFKTFNCTVKELVGAGRHVPAENSRPVVMDDQCPVGAIEIEITFFAQF